LPSHETFDAFNIVYYQYWPPEGVEESFLKHLIVLKAQFAHAHMFFPKEEGVEPISMLEPRDPFCFNI